MVDMSGCCSIAPAPTVLDTLIRSAVHRTFGHSTEADEVQVFGRSALFGLRFGVPIPLTELEATTPEGWKRFWLDPPDELRREMHRQLRAIESQISSGTKSALSGASSMTMEMRKRCYMARLVYEMWNRFLAAAAEIGKGQDDFLKLSLTEAIGLIELVPPLDVETSLAAQHEQQRDRQQSNNDYRDVNQLAMAIPYCDIVVTEKYWVDKATRECLPQRYDTVLLSSLVDVERHLEAIAGRAKGSEDRPPGVSTPRPEP
jgi:hypothetical protein